MVETHTPRPIERSVPHYRRNLVLAGVVFSAMLCANLYVFGHLVFRDMGDRMRKEVVSKAQHRALEIARKLAEEGKIDLLRVHDRMTVFSSYVNQVLTRENYVKTVTVFDAEGNLAQTWTERGGKVFSSAPGFHVEHPSALAAAPTEGGPSDSGPTWTMDTREHDHYLAAPIPSAGEPSNGAVEVGIDEGQLRREIDDLRRSLTIKIAAGAAISILLLVIAFVYVIQLLAKTRKLEAEAQMADRLAYVGTLASGLAHEIRNPLNAMNMNLQMLEEEVAAGAGKGDPEAASLLASTKGEIRRLESLVNDFLSYARPAEPRFEAADLNRTVDEVVRFLRADLFKQGIVIETRFSSSLPSVEMDEAQMRQALMNLLINAKQVLGEGGRIMVSTGVGEKGEALVRIQDNGPGIAPELRSRIFEAFYSTRGGGTGLGLPIVQRILHTHGGWISLESEVGKGTTFVLHLPRVRRPEDRPVAVAVQTS